MYIRSYKLSSAWRIFRRFHSHKYYFATKSQSTVMHPSLPGASLKIPLQ